MSGADIGQLDTGELGGGQPPNGEAGGTERGAGADRGGAGGADRPGLTSGLAAIGVAVILISVNPLAGHAVARAIAIRRGATWSDPQDDATGSPGEEQ